MKVTLTIAELTALVVDRYSLPSDATLEIAGLEKTGIAEKIISMHRAGDCLDTYGNIVPSKKIAAIKLLRDFINNERGAITADQKGNACGLAQGKFAVEEYQTFLSYVRRFGIPPMGHNDPVAWRAM